MGYKMKNLSFLKIAFASLVIGIGVSNSAAFAVCGGSTNSSSCEGTVTAIRAHDFSSIYISTNQIETALSASSCTPINNHYLKLEKTHNTFEELYALLLMARTNAEEVFIKVRPKTAGDTNSSCIVDFVEY